MAVALPNELLATYVNERALLPRKLLAYEIQLVNYLSLRSYSTVTRELCELCSSQLPLTLCDSSCLRGSNRRTTLYATC